MIISLVWNFLPFFLPCLVFLPLGHDRISALLIRNLINPYPCHVIMPLLLLYLPTRFWLSAVAEFHAILSASFHGLQYMYIQYCNNDPSGVTQVCKLKYRAKKVIDH